MVVVCAVPNCPRKKTTTNISTRSHSIQFHRFPVKTADLLEKWVKAMKLPNFKPTINTYLCSAHFKDSDYDVKGSTKQLKPNAVPSNFASSNEAQSQSSTRKSKKVVMPEPESEESDEESKMDEDEYGIIEQLEDDDDSQVMEEDEEEEEDEDDEEEELPEEVKEVVVQGSKKDELSGLLSKRGSDTLQLLIVGDDGKITNSEYLFKKEEEAEALETKPDIHKLQNLIYANEPIEEEPIKVSETKKIESHSRSSQTSSKFKENTQINQNLINKSKEEINKNKEEIKKLEEKLALSRKKVKKLHKRCRRTEKKVKELKVLLKLLVLKRGKGVRNLSQLFEEYAKKTDTGTLSY